MIARIVREEGQAIAEYAVILALIAGTLILAYSSLGTTTLNMVNQLVSQL